jgi:stress-induced morphogen
VAELLEETRSLIETALPGAAVEVIDEGGGDHLRVIVAAPQFAGKSRIDQHRLVKAAVRELSDSGALHSLTVKTIPGEPNAPAE